MDLSPYRVCWQWVEGCILASVEFDDQWEIVEPEDERIAYKRQGNRHLYCAHMGDVSVSDVFAAIMRTVEYNQELKRKSDLLNLKIQELYELFANEDLDTLRTLTFKVNRKQQKRNRKKTVETETAEESQPTEGVMERHGNFWEENNKPVEPLEEIR